MPLSWCSHQRLEVISAAYFCPVRGQGNGNGCHQKLPQTKQLKGSRIASIDYSTLRKEPIRGGAVLKYTLARRSDGAGTDFSKIQSRSGQEEAGAGGMSYWKGRLSDMWAVCVLGDGEPAPLHVAACKTVPNKTRRYGWGWRRASEIPFPGNPLLRRYTAPGIPQPFVPLPKACVKHCCFSSSLWANEALYFS